MNWETFSVFFLVVATQCGLAEEIFELRTFGENKKCLTVEPGNVTDGAEIVLLPCISSEPNFQWYRIRSKKEPEYFNILTNKADNKCLSVRFQVENRAGLAQWNCEDNGSQQWMIIASDISHNVVYIKNKFNGKCVAVNDENLIDGSKIVQWDCDDRYNQQLYVLPPFARNIVKDGTTTELRTFGEKSKCLALPHATKTDGARVVLLPCNATGHNFDWHTIKYKSDPEYFNIFTNNTDSKCLTLPEGNTRNGASLVQWNCGDTPNQLWKFVESDLSPNVIYLKNKFSGKCVTVNAGDLRNGAGLVQWNCLNRYNQQLYLPKPKVDDTTGGKGDDTKGGKGDDTKGGKGDDTIGGKGDDTKGGKGNDTTGENGKDAKPGKPERIPFGAIMEVRIFGDRTKCVATEGLIATRVLPCSLQQPYTSRLHWYMVQSKSDPAYFNFQTMNPVNKCLEVYQRSKPTDVRGFLNPGNCDDSQFQQWKFMESDMTPGAVYLVNKFTGKCATIPEPLAAPFLFFKECSNEPVQQFYLQATGLKA